jgi:hypothetical protein
VEHKFDVLCLDRKTGKILWQRTATTAVPHEGGHNTYGSFASNSPVTDGKYVYAFFGSRGMYCYDFKGTLIWEKDFGVQMRMRMGFGEGMAPVLAGDKLILVFDHEGDSFMLVLDTKTGKEIWRASRDEKSNWAAPLVVTFKGRTEVIVAGSNKVRSYDLENGKMIWECAGLGANAIPQPVRQDDMVFVMTGYRNPMLMAIRLGREGDLTGTDALGLDPDQGQFLHAVAGHLRQQALRADRHRGGQLLQRQDRRALLPPDPVAQDLQLQVVAGRRQRAALPGDRERGRGRPPDGREVRGPGHQHDDGSGVHRHPGDCRRRDLPPEQDDPLLHPLEK